MCFKAKGACKVIYKSDGVSVADEILDCAETGSATTEFG